LNGWSSNGKWIDKRDGVCDESEKEKRVHADFLALLRNAGSSKYKQLVKPAGLPLDEYNNLLVTLAPYESDGPDDTEEWNLFDTYLDSTVKAFNNPHALSTMLQRWHDDVVGSLYTSLRLMQRHMANQVIRH
jgi:hypothetical protein